MTKNDFFIKIVKEFELDQNSIITIYPYGSHNYGTNHEKSDYDFIIIMKDGSIEKDSMESSDAMINGIVYQELSWLKLIQQHKVFAMESIFLPKEKLIYGEDTYNDKFKLNLSTLRKSVSEKSSHSWVKAKKKFEVEQDRNIYIGKKSLFHSLRIINFGIQIAKNGKIVDFESMKNIWNDIYLNKSDNWEVYYNLYHNYFNEQMTEFRKFAPK